MADLGLGTADLVDFTVGGQTKCSFWQKRHRDTDVMMGATYTLNPETSPDEAYQVCQEYAETNFGIQLGAYLHHRRYEFLVVALDQETWDAEWSSLQGQDGLYFTGEVFLGTGVPGIAFHAMNVLPFFFPAVTTATEAPTMPSVGDDSYLDG
jgi:hypothetical protein